PIRVRGCRLIELEGFSSWDLDKTTWGRSVCGHKYYSCVLQEYRKAGKGWVGFGGKVGPVMEQYHEILRILGQYTHHNLMMDAAISAAVIIDKLPPSGKEFKHGKNQIGSSSVNMVKRDGVKNSNNNKNKRKFKSGNENFANKKGTITFWKCKKTGHVKKDCRSRKGNDGTGSNGFKDPEKQQGYNYDFMQNFVNVSVISDAFYVQDDEVAWWVESDATSHVCKDLSRDAIFDKERFTSIPRPRGMIQPSLSKIAEDEVAGTDDVPGLSVPKKSTRKRKAKSFGNSSIRLLLALAAIHNHVIHQMDVETAFLNDDLDEEIYMKQHEGFVMPGHESNVCKLKKSLPDIAFAVGKLSRYTSNPSALHWKALGRVFQYLKGTMDYGLTYSGYPSVIEGYFDASWINNMEDHSSTSGWVFLLGGGVISWASKKQTCITRSTMESEFVALAVASNEAEWLRNFVYEIPLWLKLISTMSIRCDSATTLAKAYSQVYNADHLTKGLARDLARKVAIGMVLKST
nr:zinc finger, CCHC-type [Tanacetum cinerariifolium]